jgi:hypothetical protein
MTGEPASTSAADGSSFLQTIRNGVAPRSAETTDQQSEPALESQEEGGGSGLHDVIKATDVWFNYQLSLLEKFAVTQAEEWAKAGIPRQDAPVEGELPVETNLKARAEEIFQEWIARTRRKVQDSVQAASAEAVEKVVQFRHTFTQLEKTTVEKNTTEEEIRDRQEALLNQQKTFGAEPISKHKRLYLVLLLAISVIEWIANVPIFSELLPEEPGTRLIWRKLVANTQQMGAVGGIYRVLEKIGLYPDKAIFAFGVIIFLMVLAHFGGEGWRAWVVFNPGEEPLLAPALQARRRQAVVPIFTALAGIVLAISFLFGSRARLQTAVTEGYNQAQQHVNSLKAELEQPNSAGKQLSDVQRQLDLEQQLEAAQSRLKDWEERFHYARDIGMMNFPILILNVVLALTALTASYCVAAPKIVEGKLIDPIIPELKSKVATLRLDVINERQLLRTLDAQIQTAISRSKYLAGTQPHAEWRAKAQRLNAVVTLFRAENARFRGVDPESIIAFRQRSSIEFPTVPDEGFQLPEELGPLEEEFESLRLEFQGSDFRAEQLVAAGGEA